MEGTDLAPNAKFTLTYPGGGATVTRDQSRGGGAWHLLRTVSLAANDNWRVDLSDRAAGPVAADAVSLVPVGALPGFTWAPTLPSAGTWQVFARWPALEGLARDAVYEVVHADGTENVRVSQGQGGGGSADLALRSPGQQDDPITGLAYNYFRENRDRTPVSQTPVSHLPRSRFRSTNGIECWP